MTPQEVIERIGHSTAQAGMQVVRTQLYGVDTLVARTAEFRLRWMATKLHTFLVASPFAPGTANRSALDGFMSAAMQYAKANKGGLPVGFQTGIAVLVVAVTEQADAAAQEWAATPHGRQFGVIPFPVMVDAASHQLTRPQRMVIGGIYSGYLKDMVDRHVGGALQWRPAE
jgi:hypothetical protein